MSRLNTMYPDDEFLKNISDMMGKLDNKNETEIKQEIEQIGYKEFYRYYKEKDVYIKQLKEQLEASEKAIKEAIKYLYEHSQYVDEYGIHYIKEDEYCVDYLLDILDIDKGE